MEEYMDIQPPVAEAAPPADVAVVDVQFRPGQKIYFFDPAGLDLAAGDHVILDTARGPEYGLCTAGNHNIRAAQVVAPLRKVLRKATAKDEQTVQELRAKEKGAFEICYQKIAESKLDMQLVSAECAFDGSKLLFFFTADERVDFRELVKTLAGIFHTRIELRQIGVRDKAKMVGGLGICGRPFCCATFLEDFQPVSIKMAKTQNLSLNPTKISGTCGRLMCCLKYEQDAYEDLLRTSPKPESFVDTPDGRGTVVEVNLLRQSVKVRMERSPETINSYANDEIAVLRSGKAKKTDPPIPEDLAPISGSGVRPRRKEPEQVTTFLDPIRFRYRTDDVVETPEPVAEPTVEAEAAPAAQPERPPKKNRSRRSGGKPRPESDAPKAETPKPENAAEAKKPKPPRKPRPQKQSKPQQPKNEAAPAQEFQQSKQPQQQTQQPKTRKSPYRNYRRRKPSGGAKAAE